MMIFDNNKKFIKIEFNDNIQCDTNSKKTYYTMETPTIICNSKEDIETIQKQINVFIIDLCKKIVK